MMTLPPGDTNNPSLQSNSTERSRRGAVWAWWPVFAALFVYVLIRIDPRMLYHAYLVSLPGRDTQIVFPEFFCGWEFFQGFIALPGGMTEYVAAFANQLFFYPVAGAAVLTGVAMGVFFLSGSIAGRIGLGHARAIALIPVWIVVIAWGRYTFHLADQFALLGALAVVRLYLGVPRAMVRTFGLVLLSPVIYAVIGAPFVLAAAMCGLSELLVRRQALPAVCCSIVGAGVPYLVGVELMGVDVFNAYGRLSGPLAIEPLESSAGVWEMALAAALAICFLLLVCGRWVLSRLTEAPVGAPSRAACSPGRGQTCVLALVVVVLGAAIVVVCHDRLAGRVLTLNRYARTGQWDRLLEAASLCRPDDLSAYSRRQINRALFETGQLGDRMFAFPQRPDGLLPDPMLDDIGFGLEEHLLAIGAVNQAEHLACESMTVRGPAPHTLRILALAFMAKEETQAARVFLTRLSGDLIHGRWARRCLAQLADDPAGLDDPTVQHIRSVMPRRDAVDTGDLETTLRTLLEANPRNRMAFEYLMAHYLLNWQLDDLADLGALLPAMPYSVLPDHYAEALIIRSPQNPPPSVHGLKMTDTVSQRADLFTASSAAHSNSARAFSDALASDLPDSYFRYYSAGQSGRAQP